MTHLRAAIAVVLVLVALLASGCYMPLPMAPASAQVAPTPTVGIAPVQSVEEEPPANALEAQVVAVYESAGPAVVNITSRVIVYGFFNQAVPQEGAGSGFVYDDQGHIVTNYHVVADADAVSVSFAGGEVYPAEIVGTDPSNDLAVLRIAADNLPSPLPLADSDRLRVGSFVVALGNPFGVGQTLTVGVISALGRVIQSPDGRFIGEAIQTDAAVNPGNSGGPLLDLRGRVIGVNSQIISPTRASAGIGFAVSSNTVRRVVPELIARGRYPHPWLGVSLFDLTAERAELLSRVGVELPVQQGLLVLEVVPGGPAMEAGIRGGQRVVTVGNLRFPAGGDILLAINGQPLRTTQDLTLYLDAQTRVGQKVSVKINREGQELEVDVLLAERPQAQ